MWSSSTATRLTPLSLFPSNCAHQMKHEISQKVILQLPTIFAHLVLFFFTDFSCNSNSLSVTCFFVVFWNLSAAEFFSAVCKVCISISGFISHVSVINSNYQQMIYNNEMPTNICYVTFTRANHKILGLQVSSTWISNILNFRLLMSYIYGAPILDVSRSHTTTQHSR